MAATFPWKVRHHATLGKLNQGHPHLRGCLEYFDAVEIGTHLAGTAGTTYYNRQMGNQNFHQGSGTGQPGTSDRIPKNVEGQRHLGESPDTSNTTVVSNNPSATARTNGVDQIKPDNFCVMFWLYYQDHTTAPYIISRYDNALPQTTWQVTTTAAEFCQIRVEDNAGPPENFNTCGQTVTGLDEYKAMCWTANGSSCTLIYLNADKTWTTAENTSWNSTFTSPVMSWGSAQTMNMNAGSSSGASTQDPIIQYRFYTKYIPVTKCKQMMMDPWAPRSPNGRPYN
jgi:hypothetical protein